MAVVAPQLIGESALFHALLDRVSDIAALDRSLLLLGERGTGKELIASRVHFLSPRWEQTYIRVDCAAFTDEALEVELFGDGHSSGRVMSANDGTLFLDNIDVCPEWMQAKLTRLIEYGTFEAPESYITETVDVRVIAAISPLSDVNALSHGDALSSDLLDRLTAHVLTLPPLRIRPDDISPLVTYFGKKIVSELGAERFPGITPEALAFLQARSWPGNVRELKNVIDRSTAEAFLLDESLAAPIHHMILNPFETAWGNEIALDANLQSDVGPNIMPRTQTMSASEVSVGKIKSQTQLNEKAFTDRVMIFERGLIDQALDLYDHHQGKAANSLGLTYHQFRGLLRKHGIKK